jgi:EmrB/QacA subfamily drug resistance transporter
MQTTDPIPAEEPPLNPHRWLVMTAVGVGSLLGSIDNNVVSIALPTIRHQFNADVASAEWVITIYLLMACSFLLSFGRLGDMRGQKPIYIWGFATFVAASALCGLAPSIPLLILFRAIQGLGVSMLFSTAPAILTMNFPGSQRGRVLGLQVVMVYVGSMIGPMLGGWLTDVLSWRAVFYINVPIGLTALVLGVKFIPNIKPAKTGERFDFAGAALFMAAFAILTTALNQGHSAGWNSPYIAKMFAAAAVLLAAFVWTESRTAAPLLDLTMFRVAAFSLSAVSSICNYIGLFTIGFLLPFYLIQGHGISSSRAGMLLTIQPIVMIVVAPTAGAISDRIGTRLPAMLGMGLLAIATFMFGQMGSTTPLMYVGVSLAIAGLGVGIFVAPNNSTMMGSAPRNRQGIAAGVLATARYIGMILGVGIAGAIFTTFLRSETQAAFFAGIRAAFLTASGISCIGCFTSAARKQTMAASGPRH